MEAMFDFRLDARRGSIQRQLQGLLGSNGWALALEQAQLAGIPPLHHRTLRDVELTIDNIDIAPETKEHMRAVYGILADAEAKVHGATAEEVHFHEVGDAAGLLNALAICNGFTMLGANEVTATCVQVGSGTIECAHGVMEVPAPATQAILDTGIPICPERLEGELCTPTSAALIKHFVTRFIS